MTFGWILLLAGVMSWALTGYLRRYALTKNLIDIPNERSSHSIPTPRGGGVAIVAAFLTMLPVLTGMGLLTRSDCFALWGAGAVVALTGFLDDHGHIAARWRLLVHFSATAWGLYWLGGFPSLTVLGYRLEPNWLVEIGAAFYVVWMLNLYNFMDGIDGLAGVEAITACCGAALLSGLAVSDTLAWLAPLGLAAAVFGFLVWNFPPARIFMGDAGSGFLGIVLALLAVQAARFAPQLFWSWLILMGVFVVDATVTLCRRVRRGEKFYQAHRSHAYQYASRLYGAHRPVTLSVAAINIVWLLPIAALVALRKVDGAVGLIAAYLPLLVLAYRYKAGDSRAQAE